MNKVIREEILDNIIDNMQEWEAMQAAINILNEWHGTDEIVALLVKRQKELDEKCREQRELLMEG